MSSDASAEALISDVLRSQDKKTHSVDQRFMTQTINMLASVVVREIFANFTHSFADASGDTECVLRFWVGLFKLLFTIKANASITGLTSHGFREGIIYWINR